MFEERNEAVDETVSGSSEQAAAPEFVPCADQVPETESIPYTEQIPVAEPEPKKEKKEHKWLKTAGFGAVFGLCAGLVFLAVAFVGQQTFLKDTQKKEVVIETTETVEEPDVTTVEEPEVANTIAQITKNCMPSVVAITTKNIDEISSFWGTQQYESEGAGSGIIVGKSETELLVATNNHVVSGATEVSVCFNDSEDAVVTAKVKGSDAANDLAVVAIALEDISDDILSSIKVATIGDSSEVQVGDQVIAIGNALGFGQSVTTGIVSALEREVEIDELDAKLIQTDAAINPGNSGGALLNMEGELIGINSAKFASELVEGMGYAIPIATAQPILDNLMNRETRELAGDKAGYLGVSVQDVSKEASENYGIPKGAYIASTEEGAAAANAGLKEGDIITKFDGISISSAADLSSMIAYYKKGEQIEVTYMRSDNGAYKESVVTVTLTESEQIKEQKKQQNNQTQDDDDQDEWSQENPFDDYNSGEDSMPSQDQMEEFFRYFFGN
nr:trypsin-like peptidase domain-containing protein [Lachnospiraceae bacterium]